MTRFRPNIVVSDVFGSAGDVTAHHRDGKTYLRKRSRPVHPMTEAQAAHLEVHRRALAAWREVPDTEKERWNAYAREVEPRLTIVPGYRGRICLCRRIMGSLRWGMSMCRRRSGLRSSLRLR